MKNISKALYKYLGFIFLNLFSFATIQAQYYVEYNGAAREIYKDIIDLKLKIVPAKLDEFKKENPNNLASIHLDNYLDFFTLFINEEEALFKNLKKQKTKRIKEVESKLSDKDPYKRFLIAEINLQWALTRSKFGELFKAGREIYTSYNLLTDNVREFPNFILNKKSLSILHSLVETITIPGFFKSLLGLEGSVSLAMKEINLVIENQDAGHIFIEESDAIKAYILFYQANEKIEAWDFIENSSLNENESLLATFLKTKFAQRIGKNEMAISFLMNRPVGDDYSTFCYLDYQHGLSLLRALDPNAKKYLNKFVNEFNGRHFIKEAYQKLAWSELVFNNDTLSYFDNLSSAKNNGDDLVDDDKQALLESKNKTVPNIALLRARLLFDGGYLNETIDLLTEIKDDFKVGSSNYIEYAYRLGRSLQMMNDYDEAKKYLLIVLECEAEEKSYYDCNAALQIAFIEEKRNNYSEAKKYFETCLSINPKSYKHSLHQKAKSGLYRLNR